MAERNHRDYDNKYPSVTTILGVLRKMGLEYWFKVNTLKYITEATNKGKTIGTQTHEAIEHFINTGTAKIESEYPDEVTFALKSFMLFRKEHPEIVLKLTETKLTSEVYKYNGTLDAPCPPVLIDWKTGEAKEKETPTIYDEWKYQASAYVNLWNENNPDNIINKVIIVAIAKDKVAYKLCEMEQEEINGCFNEVFLPALKILTYQRKGSKNGEV